MRKKVGGQCEDGRDVGCGGVHVDADERARQPDGDDDERGGKCADGRRARVGGGEDGLDVGLRGDDSDDEREESCGDALGAGVSEAPCAGRERRVRCECRKSVPGGDACEAKTQPQDDHLQDAADACAFYAAEEDIAGDERDEGECRRAVADAEDCGDEMESRQRARDGAEEDADGRNEA